MSTKSGQLQWALARELRTTPGDLLHAAGYLSEGEWAVLDGGVPRELWSLWVALVEADRETQAMAGAG